MDYVKICESEGEIIKEYPLDEGKDGEKLLLVEMIKSEYPKAVGLRYLASSGTMRVLRTCRDGKYYVIHDIAALYYIIFPKNEVVADMSAGNPRSDLRENRPPSPYMHASFPAPPMSKSIDKWMFYSTDSAGKSTVVCVHSRYFVTFRHGTHLEFKIGDCIKIFHAKDDNSQQDGYDVTVVDINEQLDFILLKSMFNVVAQSPRLTTVEESESFLLAGFGNKSTEEQQLGYLNGVVYSKQGYFFSINDRPSIVMGPFMLGTVQSSRGDSGGACWSANGLIGINFGVTTMPETSHSFAIAEAATFSPKNIISPSIPFISMALMAQLRMEKHNPVTPPEKKRKLHQTEIEGIGTGSLTTNFDN